MSERICALYANCLKAQFFQQRTLADAVGFLKGINAHRRYTAKDVPHSSESVKTHMHAVRFM